MTITRIWNSGFDSGSVLEADGGVFAISPTTPRTGPYSAQVQINAPNRYFVKNIVATDQIRTGFSFYVASFLQVEGEILTVRDASSELFNINLIPSTGDLRLEVTGTSQGVTTDHPIVEGVFYHIGIDCKIDPTSGWVYAYLVGKEILSVDGGIGSTDIEILHYGTYTDQGEPLNYFRYDDVYIDDTTGEGAPTGPPIKRFYPVIPNAEGNYSEWIPSPTGTHYELVDERPPDGDTTHVYAITGSVYDSYGMTTFTLDANEDIMALIPFAISKRDFSTEQIALGTRSSGTDSVGSDQDLSLSYNYVWERQTTGSLGAPWNQSYLDSVEVIIKSAGTY